MTSFMTKKKKYKFQVEICLEELLEVPFVAAVLFAKLRLDGGGFQDHSSRQEVKDHKVQWDAKFSFPCKMMANASTGVMEKCILRISIRKECKGGRSFNKLGFVDLNLAEYAGAGLIHKKALLEGYDTRHRQDNSMLKFRINLNMISGDILFKAPSPSQKHKQIPMDDLSTDSRPDDFSSDSLAGSINSGSSGFGSLPKRRTPLPNELVIGQTLAEPGVTTATTPFDQPGVDLAPPTAYPDQQNEYIGTGYAQEPGHSRNSSNTSQMSKASGYSSISHSRQSSSGDSTAGHNRNALQHESLRRPPSKFHRTYTFPKHHLHIPTTILSESPGPNGTDFPTFEVYHTPQGSMGSPSSAPISNGQSDVFYTPSGDFVTPRKYQSESTPTSFRTHQSGDMDDVFRTPDGCFNTSTNIFDKNFIALQKSASSSVVERIRTDSPVPSKLSLVKNDNPQASEDLTEVTVRRKISYFEKNSQNNFNNNYIMKPPVHGVLRSKSDFIIPKISPTPTHRDRSFSDIISSFLTPRLSRKEISAQSVKNGSIPPLSLPLSNTEARAVSMGNLKIDNNGHLAVPGPIYRLHRKMLLDGAPTTKLVPMAPCNSPSDGHVDEDSAPMSESQRRPSTSPNPSSGSLATSSETGSLDRAKAAYERRKKNPSSADDAGGGAPGRVETTRVNPEDCIAELLKSSNLEQPDESAETSGLQLFIAKDGTASLGNHEVKSQMSTFKQVVMDDR